MLDGNSKPFHKHLERNKNDKQMAADGSTTDDSSECANNNIGYSTITLTSNCVKNHQLNELVVPEKKITHCVPVDSNGVVKLLMNLKNGKASGPSWT